MALVGTTFTCFVDTCSNINFSLLIWALRQSNCCTTKLLCEVILLTCVLLSTCMRASSISMYFKLLSFHLAQFMETTVFHRCQSPLPPPSPSPPLSALNGLRPRWLDEDFKFETSKVGPQTYMHPLKNKQKRGIKASLPLLPVFQVVVSQCLFKIV